VVTTASQVGGVLSLDTVAVPPAGGRGGAAAPGSVAAAAGARGQLLYTGPASSSSSSSFAAAAGGLRRTLNNPSAARHRQRAQAAEAAAARREAWGAPGLDVTRETALSAALAEREDDGDTASGAGGVKGLGRSAAAAALASHLLRPPAADTTADATAAAAAGRAIEVNGEIIDVAALERAQQARDRLPPLLPPQELLEEMKRYKRALTVAREIREAPFRARGYTLAEAVEGLADALAAELCDEVRACLHSCFCFCRWALPSFLAVTHHLFT